MSDASNVTRALRDRLGTGGEDLLGRALSDLLESPLLTGALGRAFDAREKATQAQEVALSALNIPSAADLERLTRRLRAVSHRLEGIEDGVDRLDRALTPSGVEARLAAIENQIGDLSEKLDRALRGAGESGKARSTRGTAGSRPSARGRAPSAGAEVARADKQVRAAREAKSRKVAKASGAAKVKSPAGPASGPGERSRANRVAPGKA
jgi:hypothetical protein